MLYSRISKLMARCKGIFRRRYAAYRRGRSAELQLEPGAAELEKIIEISRTIEAQANLLVLNAQAEAYWGYLKGALKVTPGSKNLLSDALDMGDNLDRLVAVLIATSRRAPQSGPVRPARQRTVNLRLVHSR